MPCSLIMSTDYYTTVLWDLQKLIIKFPTFYIYLLLMCVSPSFYNLIIQMMVSNLTPKYQNFCCKRSHYTYYYLMMKSVEFAFYFQFREGRSFVKRIHAKIRICVISLLPVGKNAAVGFSLNFYHWRKQNPY